MKAVISHQYHGAHPPSPTPATKISIPVSAGGGAEAALLGKGRYKAWALVAISLLALWSMFAASVTLRWSSGDLAAASRDLNGPLIDDLDPLEMEEREKLVRRMWDLYTRTGDHVWLPRFWQEAFEAAYEELAGDDMPASDAAVSEIARMAIHRPELEQHCIFTFRKFIATAKTRTEIEYTTRDVIAITIMCSQKQYTVNIWRSGGPNLQGE